MQGFGAPIAISSLIVFLMVAIFKLFFDSKGDDIMGKKIVLATLDILYNLSANLAGGALLTKVLQLPT